QIDVLLTKQNTFGQILWEKQFGTPNQKNYGVSLTFDNNDNIYVIAASQSNTDQFYNYLIIKYDPNANELWHQYHDGDGGDDIPTDLSYESTEGKLYVTGTSVQTNNEYDYLTLKVNPANGNIEWERTYEFAQLNDIAASIVTYGSGRIVVTGGSADSPTDWDIATVMYNGSGVEIHVNRIKNPTPGFDQPTGIVKDINGDFFITGNRSNTSGDYDIYTVKFDEALDIIWEKYFDGAGKEDNAYDIKIDTSGNLYVCGTTEKSNNGKDFLLIKYDNNGDQLWTQRRRADNHLNAAIAKKIALEPNGDVVVAGEIYQGLSTQTLVVKYDEQGKKLWETKPNTSDSFVADRYVTGVHTNDGNIYVGSITDGGANDRTYETSQLETYDRNLTFEYDTEGNPTQAAGEVIIRFHPDIVNTNFVDDASVSYGTISEIINDPTLINSMSSALNGGKDFSNWKMLKIFHGLNTSITTTTTRTGEVIPIPRLWSAMVLKLENGMSVSNAVNNLEAISSGILYAHPNTAFSGDTPNDPEYGLQQSIKST
ncbi:MAG: SBBP repeat-containing protein, partial [Bacteroidota bacterium]